MGGERDSEIQQNVLYIKKLALSLSIAAQPCIIDCSVRNMLIRFSGSDVIRELFRNYDRWFK